MHLMMRRLGILALLKKEDGEGGGGGGMSRAERRAKSKSKGKDKDKDDDGGGEDDDDDDERAELARQLRESKKELKKLREQLRAAGDGDDKEDKEGKGKAPTRRRADPELEKLRAENERLRLAQVKEKARASVTAALEKSGALAVKKYMVSAILDELDLDAEAELTAYEIKAAVRDFKRDNAELFKAKAARTTANPGTGGGKKTTTEKPKQTAKGKGRKLAKELLSKRGGRV